jgi:hypothetical protein
LQQITSAEIRPHLEAAERFGVQKIYFTGGEVFVNEDVLQRRAERNEEFLSSLRLALEISQPLFVAGPILLRLACERPFGLRS